MNAPSNERLLNHIRRMNARTRAWVAEDPQNRMAGDLTEDLDHWAQYAITTPEQLDHYLLVHCVYDATEYAWGFKPNWDRLNKLSDDELNKQLELLRRSSNAAEKS